MPATSVGFPASSKTDASLSASALQSKKTRIGSLCAEISHLDWRGAASAPDLDGRSPSNHAARGDAQHLGGHVQETLLPATLVCGLGTWREIWGDCLLWSLSTNLTSATLQLFDVFLGNFLETVVEPDGFYWYFGRAEASRNLRVLSQRCGRAACSADASVSATRHRRRGRD